jgi:hypothetical protein
MNFLWVSNATDGLCLCRLWDDAQNLRARVYSATTSLKDYQGLFGGLSYSIWVTSLQVKELRASVTVGFLIWTRQAIVFTLWFKIARDEQRRIGVSTGNPVRQSSSSLVLVPQTPVQQPQFDSPDQGLHAERTMTHAAVPHAQLYLHDPGVILIDSGHYFTIPQWSTNVPERTARQDASLLQWMMWMYFYVMSTLETPTASAEKSPTRLWMITIFIYHHSSIALPLATLLIFSSKTMSSNDIYLFVRGVSPQWTLTIWNFVQVISLVNTQNVSNRIGRTFPRLHEIATAILGWGMLT